MIDWFEHLCTQVEDVEPTLTWEQMTQQPEATAAEAIAWLAQQGIVAPPAKREERETAATAAAATEEVECSSNLAEEDERLGGTMASMTGDAGDEAAGEVSDVGIETLLAYRVLRGNEQWQVRWQGYDGEADTWELWPVLDTEGLRRHA